MLGCCALAANILTSPLEQLITIVPDDAFYYLQIARNLAATGWSTADGLSTTNGYHPLWLALLTPLAALVSDRELLLRAAVGTSVLLHLVASWLVSARVTQLAGPAWGRSAGVCWLLNPVAILMALLAMESTLYVVMLLAAFGVHLRLAATLAAGQRPAAGVLMVYGGALGFACLARTEGAVVAALALAWLGVRLSRSSIRRTDVAASWTFASGAALLIVLPWLLFSLWQVGTIQQDSGVMKALWAADVFPDAASRLRNLLDTGDYFLRRSVRLMLWPSFPLRPITIAPLACAAGFVALQLSRPRSRAAIATRAAVLPATIIGGIYGLTLVERQIWWLGLPWLTMFLVATVSVMWCCRAVPALRRQQRSVRAVMVAMSMIAFLAFARAPLTPYPWQRDVLRSRRRSKGPSRKGSGSAASMPAFRSTLARGASWRSMVS